MADRNPLAPCQGRRMSQRRFTHKPDLDPEHIRSLPADHAAMVERRTLFPTTVVEVTEAAPERLLISGANNRKIGSTVEKGAFKDYEIYTLSLEERATCPEDCEALAYCYGNGMHQARRHRIGDSDVFFDRLGMEIADLAERCIGVLIRLHVLGDFPSVEYVAFWKEVLEEYPNVACFGYTHRSPKSWGGDEIGDAVQSVKDVFGDRFRIRWSSPVARDDGAIVISHVPTKAKTVNGEIVCPAQTDATACCATCGLCWDATLTQDCIAFIKHGPKQSLEDQRGALSPAAKTYWADRGKVSEPAPEPELEVEKPTRKVRAIDLPDAMRDAAKASLAQTDLPELKSVAPESLVIEEAYQRDLSPKSLKMIKRIVAKWDWAKFKPPVCAETKQGLFVIDGQHTAIAAATHPGVSLIPIMVVHRVKIEERAAAFVSQNRDRVNISPLQVFHAELAAGDKVALGILRAAVKAGVEIPRNPPAKGKAKPGEVVSVSALRHLYAGNRADHLQRALTIAKLSKVKPINSTLLRAIDLVLRETAYRAAAKLTDEQLGHAIEGIGNLEKEAEIAAAEMDCSKYRAAAALIANHCEETNNVPAEAAE